MIGKPIQTAHIDDPAALKAARSAAWAIYNKKGHPGYRRIGAGHFSAVFSIASRPGLVLKIGGPGGYGRSFGDPWRSPDPAQPDAWPCYVQWLSERHHDTQLPDWAPRVYHVEALGTGFYFALIERLQPGGYAEARDKVSRGLRGMVADGSAMYGAADDMHAGNFMLRGNAGVITDPWYMRSE